MAAFAGDRFVLVAEGIFCVPVMIECHLFPGAVRVAALTFLAEVALVHIVLLVAGVTGERRWLIAAIGMTAQAFYGRMFSREREFRLVVIEARYVLPFFFRMACVARKAERALMHIVFLVAGMAGRRGLLFRGGGFVATFACGCFVLPE